jgi:hypothetical protein
MTAGTTAQETVEMADATVAAARLTVPAKKAQRPACCILVVVESRGKKPKIGFEWGPRICKFCGENVRLRQITN